jgi:DNA-binding NarL/FixJ family response regulator
MGRGIPLIPHPGIRSDPRARRPNSLRLLIAEDSEFVRIGLRLILRERPDWDICEDAANGREAISKVSELAPDVVLLDVAMPVMNGFEAAKEIRLIAPGTKLVFMSMYGAPTTDVLLGADAFISKTVLTEELLATIERVVGPSQQLPA